MAGRLAFVYNYSGVDGWANNVVRLFDQDAYLSPLDAIQKNQRVVFVVPSSTDRLNEALDNTRLDLLIEKVGKDNVSVLFLRIAYVRGSINLKDIPLQKVDNRAYQIQVFDGKLVEDSQNAIARLKSFAAQPFAASRSVPSFDMPLPVLSMPSQSVPSQARDRVARIWQHITSLEHRLNELKLEVNKLETQLESVV